MCLPSFATFVLLILVTVLLVSKTQNHHAVEVFSQEVITLSFIGDVAFSIHTPEQAENEGFTYRLSPTHDPISDEIKYILRNQSDWTLANLETSVVADTTHAKPRMPKNQEKVSIPKGWFASDARDLEILRGAGITALSLANNHWFDADMNLKEEQMGIQAIRDSGILPLVGAEKKDNQVEQATGAKRTHTLDIVQLGGGLRLAVFTTNVALDTPLPCQNIITETNDLNNDDIEFHCPCLGTVNEGNPRAWKVDWNLVEHFGTSIRRESRHHHLVVVSIHWGTQFQFQVEAWQIEIANKLIEAGANLIVGHHPHRLHGMVFSGIKKLTDSLAKESIPAMRKNSKPIDNGLEQPPNLVAYSLGSSLWPIGESASGILQVKIKDGKILSTCWVPTVMENGILNVANVVSEKRSLELQHKVDHLSREPHEGSGRFFGTVEGCNYSFSSS